MASPNATAIPTDPSDWARWLSTTIAPHPAKTSAKVATASARQRRASGPLVKKFADQHPHAGIDLVTDTPDGLEITSVGIVEHPVLVALSRIDGAGVAAAHRDHDVRGPNDLVGQGLRERLAQVDADLLHRDDDG